MIKITQQNKFELLISKCISFNVTSFQWCIFFLITMKIYLIYYNICQIKYNWLFKFVGKLFLHVLFIHQVISLDHLQWVISSSFIVINIFSRNFQILIFSDFSYHPEIHSDNIKQLKNITLLATVTLNQSYYQAYLM